MCIFFFCKCTNIKVSYQNDKFFLYMNKNTVISWRPVQGVRHLSPVGYWRPPACQSSRANNIIYLLRLFYSDNNYDNNVGIFYYNNNHSETKMKPVERSEAFNLNISVG